MSQVKDKTAHTSQTTNLKGYVAGKLQKIVHALYLVTNLFPSDEPLRKTIRQKGIGLLASAEALRGTNTSTELSLNVSDSIRELLSLISLARTSGLMSEMNFSVLKAECDKLIQLEDESDIYTGPFLSNGDFALPQISAPVKTPKKSGSGSVSTISTPKQSTKTTPKRVTGVKKERRQSILSAISNGGEVNIKDVAQVVRGCSRKTIQRELGVLVDKGFVNKKGERRWSTYTLTEAGKSQIK